MRLQAVRIENFRGIEFFEATKLKDIVVVAGPNGCGKTAVLDGIRSIAGSLRRLSELGSSYSETSLETRQDQIRRELNVALTNGMWRSEFPGRLILKRFVGRYVNGVNYEGFRNIILDKMVDAGYQPNGMKEVIERIN
jgi:hypothetical protein